MAAAVWAGCPALLAAAERQSPPTDWFTRAQIDRAAAFNTQGLTLTLALLAVKAVVLVLAWRRREYIGRLVSRLVGQRWYAQVAAWAMALAFAMAALNVAAGLLRHRWDLQAGMSHQPYLSWLGDIAKVRARGIALSTIIPVGIYAAMGLLGRRWWWTGAFALVMLIRVAPPLLMAGRTANLRYDLTPLQDGPPRAHIESLIARSGHDVEKIEMAGTSRISTAANAWIGVFGAERRLVITDTMIERYTAEEIGVVVAHELGHVGQHIHLRHVALGACRTLMGLVFAHILLVRASRRERFGLPHTVPLYFLAMLASVIAFGPVSKQFSRHAEAAANRYALELTQDPDAFIAVQRRVAVENLSYIDPPPLVRALFIGHPTPIEAI